MDGYTPSQAAAVTGLPLAAVHKAIDSRLIRPRSTRSGTTIRRLLTKEQLIYLQLEAEGLRLLPVGTRRQIAESIQRSPKTEKLPVHKERVAIAPLCMPAGPRRGRTSRRPWQGKKAKGRKSFPLNTLLRSA